MAKDIQLLQELEADGWRYLLDSERDCKETPKVSGVYCFVRFDTLRKVTEVVYVGKSKDLSVRLKPWHKIEHRFDNRFGNLFCYIKPTEDFHSIEKEYIKKYTPMFNIQHNPNITRKIIYNYGKG